MFPIGWFVSSQIAAKVPWCISDTTKTCAYCRTAEPAWAAATARPYGPLAYTAVDWDSRELPAEAGARLGARVRVNEAVQARVRGRLPPAPRCEALMRLAAVYGFERSHDGGMIRVSAPSEGQTRMALGQPVAAMDEAGLSDPRWPPRVPDGHRRPSSTTLRSFLTLGDDVGRESSRGAVSVWC